MLSTDASPLRRQYGRSKDGVRYVGAFWISTFMFFMKTLTESAASGLNVLAEWIWNRWWTLFGERRISKAAGLKC